MTWCFVCCKSDKLVGCRYCPAAYHYDCIDNPPMIDTILNSSETESKLNSSKSLAESRNSSKNSSPASNHSSTSCLTSNTVNSISSNNNATSIISTNWTCEDCLLGRKPLYGQIVWSKVGTCHSIYFFREHCFNPQKSGLTKRYLKRGISVFY